MSKARLNVNSLSRRLSPFSSPLLPPPVAVALSLSFASALLACGSDPSPAPVPSPSATTTIPVVPPTPPARTLVEDAKLGGPAESLLADPQFLVPGYRPNAFFVFSPRSEAPRSTLRYAAWDTPFGRRSPALTVAATAEELALCVVFPASERGSYRASVWVSGASADGTATELPEGIVGQIVGAAGKKPIGKLASNGDPKVVGTRRWVELSGTFTSEPGNDMFLVTVPKGNVVLVAAPEVVRVASTTARVPMAGDPAPPWVSRVVARLAEVPRAKPLLPPRPEN